MLFYLHIKTHQRVENNAKSGVEKEALLLITCLSYNISENV